MKLLIVTNDNSTGIADVDVNVKGCFYPKGFVIQFDNELNLIDFIMKLPDNVWDYLGESRTAVYFTQDYYFVWKEVQDSERN